MARKPDDHGARRSSDGILDERHPDWLATQEIIAESRGETRRFMWLASIPMLLLLATVIGVFLVSRSGDTETEGEVTGPSVEEDQPAINSQEADEASSEDADDQAATAGADTDGNEATEDAGAADTEGNGVDLPPPPADAPYVDATLTDNLFVLSGIVPSADIKAELEARAELAYAPFATSELEVDESIGDAAWLAAAPEIVGLLPMITDGTIRVQDDSVTLVGRSPNPQYAAEFQAVIGQVTGLPVQAEGIEITDLVAPRFVASVADGEVTLEGEIPSQAILDSFVQGAAAVYGADNITNEMVVDEDTYTSFWNYTIPGVFQLLQVFPSFTVQVENGITTGTAQGAVLFATNSADLPPEAQEVLTIPVALLSRDQRMHLTVVGHTDNRGPDDINQQLSLERAQAVVDFIAGAGIDPARLTAEGRGSSEPIASNDTEEGLARNRRVEVRFD